MKTNLLKRTLLTIAAMFFMVGSVAAQTVRTSVHLTGAPIAEGAQSIGTPAGDSLYFTVATGQSVSGTDMLACGMARIQIAPVPLVVRLGSTSASRLVIWGNSSFSTAARTIEEIAISDSRDGTFTAVTGATASAQTHVAGGTNEGSGCWTWTIEDLDIPRGTYVRITFDAGIRIAGVDIYPVNDGDALATARHWNFLNWSEATLNDLAADTNSRYEATGSPYQGWILASNRFFIGSADLPNNTDVRANNNIISELEGIQFVFTTGDDRLRIDHGFNPPRLGINGNNQQLRILNVEANDVIEITFTSATASQSRGFGTAQLGNVVPIGENAFSAGTGAGDVVTNQFRVLADGIATFQNTSVGTAGGIFIRRISKVRAPTLTVTGAGTLPFSHNFGNVEVSETSTAFRINVSGTNLTENISATIEAGTYADYFTVTPDVAWTAAAGGYLDITFSPTNIGAHTATLTLSSVGAENISIALSGAGIIDDGTSETFRISFVDPAPLTQTAQVTVASGTLMSNADVVVNAFPSPNPMTLIGAWQVGGAATNANFRGASAMGVGPTSVNHFGFEPNGATRGLGIAAVEGVVTLRIDGIRANANTDSWGATVNNNTVVFQIVTLSSGASGATVESTIRNITVADLDDLGLTSVSGSTARLVRADLTFETTGGFFILQPNWNSAAAEERIRVRILDVEAVVTPFDLDAVAEFETFTANGVNLLENATTDTDGTILLSHEFDFGTVDFSAVDIQFTTVGTAAVVTVEGLPVTSGNMVFVDGTPVTFRVESTDGTEYAYYRVTLTEEAEAGTEAYFTAFSVGFVNIFGSLEGTAPNFTLTGELLFATDFTTPLAIAFTASDDAVVTVESVVVETGDTHTFTPGVAVQFVVTSGNGLVVNTYTVTINRAAASAAADLLTFAENGLGVPIAATTSQMIQHAADLADVEIEFAVSPFAVVRIDGEADPIESGESWDFTTARTFTVTSEDGTTTNAFVVSLATPGDENSLVWYFQDWSAATIANLEADPNWIRDGNGRFTREAGQALAQNTNVMANNVLIAELAGLQFAHSGTMGVNNVRIDYGLDPPRLGINGGNIRIVIPNALEDDIITIRFATAATEARGFVLPAGSNATPATPESNPLNSTGSAIHTTSTFVVTADGSVFFQSSAGLQVYEITLTRDFSPGVEAYLADVSVGGAGIVGADIDLVFTAHATEANTYVATQSVPYGSTLENVVFAFNRSRGSTVAIQGGAAITSPHTMNFTDGVATTFVVTAEEGGATNTYIVTLNVVTTASDEAFFTAFTVNGVNIFGTLAGTAPDFTMTHTFPYETELSDVAVTFTHSDLATVLWNSIAVTSPIASMGFGQVVATPGLYREVFRVLAQDGVTYNNYAILLTRAAPSTAAALTMFAVNGVSLPPTAAMSYELPFGTNLEAVTVTFTVSPFATLRANGNVITSGTALDFTAPIEFIVTAQDGTTTSITHTVTLTADTELRLPARWSTANAAPAWITSSLAIIPEYVEGNFTRPMLTAIGDYFYADFSTANLEAHYRLVTTEFRWDARSAAVVVIEQSVDGLTWTALDSVANNSHTTGLGGGGGNPGSGACITLLPEQGSAILISMAGDIAGAGANPTIQRQLQMARIQTLLAPEARFVRYRMSQQTGTTAHFMVQAVEVRDFPHSETVMSADFVGLDSSANAQAVEGGYVQGRVVGIINRIGTGTGDRHPCSNLWIAVNPNARVNAIGDLIVRPDAPIRDAGALTLSVASHDNNPTNIRIEYRTTASGDDWLPLNDNAWVISQGVPHTVFFEFPQVLDGITEFRFSRAPSANPFPAGATAGQRGDITWFMFDMAIGITPRPPSLDLGTVAFNNETLYFEPWTFVIPNAPITIEVEDVVATAAFPAMATVSVDTTLFPLTNADFVNDVLEIVFTVTAIDGGGLTGFETHTVSIAKDMDPPVATAITQNNLGLGETGTIVFEWDKPVILTAGHAGYRVTINGVDASSYATLETGDADAGFNELVIAFTAAHWDANHAMEIVLVAGAFDDRFDILSEEQTFNFTRDVTLPFVVADRTFPRNESTTAPMTGGIMVSFSEPIHQATIQAGMSQITLNGTALVNGVTGFFFNASSQLFVPYRELAAGQTYTLVIPAELIVDAVGNVMAEDFTLTFTTGGTLRVEHGDYIFTGFTQAYGYEFAVPSWITARTALTTPSGPAEAYRIIGFNPTYSGGGAVISGVGTIASPWPVEPSDIVGGAFRVDDTLALHFDALGELEVWLTMNGGRAWAMWPECTPSERRVSVAMTNGFALPWVEEFNISRPVTILLVPYANVTNAEAGLTPTNGILYGVRATGAPLNPLAVFETFQVNNRSVAVVADMVHGLPHDANLTSVEVTFAASHNSVVRMDGDIVTSPITDVDFTTYVEFTITSEDGLTVTEYTVTLDITERPRFETFVVIGQYATINTENNTVEYTFPETQSLAAMATVFTTNIPTTVTVGGTVIAEGAIHTQNFINPVNYVVAADTGGAPITFIVTMRGGTTSVQDLITEVVSFYPNPTTDVLNITTNSNIREIEVINMVGAVVISTSGSGTSQTLDVSSLSPGLHFIRVTTDAGISVGRFIKQ